MSAKPSICEDRCLYCRMPLPPNHHEHDHFPRAARNGGKHVECACINCHTLKDLVSVDRWPVERALAALSGVWEKCTPEERVILAKIIDTVNDR